MPLIESAIDTIAGSIIDRAIAVGQYAVKEVKGAYRDVDRKQQLIAALQKYPDKYHQRHCLIKILPGLMQAPRDLEGIYTDVKLLSERGVRAFWSEYSIEAAYRAKGKRSFGVDEGERVEGMEVVNQRQFLMVLGGPGIGKSTFLRKIGLETLRKNGAIEWEGIPVFLELKKFREETLDIKQKIIEELDICQLPEAESFVGAALAQGKLLVLFDGLDEVPAERLDLVIDKIESFVDKYSQPTESNPNADTPAQNRFVASCRTAAYRSGFRLFTDVTIAEFSDEQIEVFIRRWFSSPEDKEMETADEYLKLLNQDEHLATKELAQTPLLLTFLCLVYDREQTLPSKRSVLYGRALNIIVSEWDAHRRIRRASIYDKFHVEMEKEMLAAIAYDSFCQDRLFFSKEMITGQITDFLGDTLGAPETLDAVRVLDAIEAQQGILVERVTNTYSFSHLTLQEYLTALYVVGKRLEEALVVNHLNSDRWREIFLLVAGLNKSPVPQLFTLMETQARTYIKEFTKLRQLVHWAAASGELPERAAMLAMAIAIAIASASASNKAVAIAIDIDIDSARSRARASDNDSDSDIAIVIDIAIDSASARASAIDIAIDSAKARAIDINSAIDSAIDSARARASAIDIAGAIDIDSDRARASTRASAIDINSAIDSAIDSASNIDSTEHPFLNSKTFSRIAENLSNHRQLLPSASAHSQAWQIWAEQLQMIWIDALKLDPDALTFSAQEMEALRKYLYANELILKCKASAIRVPRSEWEALEKKMLRLDE